MDEVVSTAVEDASLLDAAGFPALMVENYGDAPFYADRVPPETVASMALAAKAVKDATGSCLGVNVLRNDATSALALAATVGADFIRVNVLTGTMHTDQGPIVGRAAEVTRLRSSLCPSVEIWADVMVKHATPPPGADPGQMALDTVERGLADAIIVSGAGTGLRPDSGLVKLVRDALPHGTRLVIGSGASTENLGEILGEGDSVIVGSSVKHEGRAEHRVDPSRAEEFINAARGFGLL
jgi:membrane complex biogenesis BtpA family protein